MARKKPTIETPEFVLRSVRANAQGGYRIAEVWDAGEALLGITYGEESSANVGKLSRKKTTAPDGAERSRFSSRHEAESWFTEFLAVDNDEWLDVWTPKATEVEPWIIDSLSFTDDESVDIVAIAEVFDDYVEEWSFQRLESIPLVWKPVRVAGHLVAGYRCASGSVTYFAFDDDSGQFGFQKNLASFSWFMDNTGAPISWNGGKAIGVVNEARRLLAVSNSGDYEEPFVLWEISPNESIANAIVDFFRGDDGDSAEHILFLELGVERGEGVFADHEWSSIVKTITESQDESFGWMNGWVTEEFRREVAEVALEKSKLYRAMHDFFTNPTFEFHDLVLESWEALVNEVHSSAWEDVFLHGSRLYAMTPKAGE